MTAAAAPAALGRARPKPFIALVRGINRVAPALKPRLQKALIRGGYQVLNRRRAALDAVCLNYGYASVASSPRAPSLDPMLSDFYGLQLYDLVAGGARLEGRDVLEVGSGRGGGTAYVSKAFGPATMLGIDFSAEAVEWCRRTYAQPGLSFQQADAEALPFGPASFDAVLNVESSHCYPDMGRFLDEAKRVLRPGGVVLFADLRPVGRVDELRDQLASRFSVEDEEDITAGVVRALELDAPRREATIEKDVPRLLRAAIRDFFATPGSEVFNHLASGGLRYLRFVLRAPGAAPIG